MASEPSRTQGTGAAGKINFTNHALANQGRWPCLDLPDEFVPWYALESHVALENLQIRGADASQADPHQRGVVIDVWHGVGRFVS
jgi:hypothetical protein